MTTLTSRTPRRTRWALRRLDRALTRFDLYLDSLLLAIFLTAVFIIGTLIGSWMVEF